MNYRWSLFALIPIFLLGIPLSVSADEVGDVRLRDAALVERAEAAKGKKIRSITIHVLEIFDEPDLNPFYQTANQLKINTRKEVVQKELLFKEGDIFDPFLIKESERNLRSLGFLRQVEIAPTAGDADSVDVTVTVQDTWTFIPQLGFSSGTGRNTMSAGAAENNLLGLGKRLEFLYREDEDRKSLEGVYEDDRFAGTRNRLLAAYFDRDDGERFIGSYGLPFRSLVEKNSWSVDADVGDTIGRLFQNGEERFIFRQERADLGARYTVARGDPEKRLLRYSAGYSYIEELFSEADDQDYEDLGLEPGNPPNNPDLLADDRRYTGPLLSYEVIEPDFISMNYIDRFDRVEDYNLGLHYLFSGVLAPEFLGSNHDAILFNATRTEGYRFSRGSFLRADIGVSTRIQESDLVNNLIRVEAKYYNVLGDLSVGSWSLGKHTLATNFYIDYGSELDKDREFLLGADNSLRGYKAKTFTGDKRLALNIEERAHLYDDVLKIMSIGTAVFFDGGGTTNQALGNIFTHEFYSDIGVGLRFGFPRSTNGSVIRLDLALPLRDGPDGSDRFEPRFLITGGQVFGSKLRSEIFGAEKANVAIGFDR
ncbi:MAG: hypothetical protein RL417_1423 [Pseudomonadota bacterium]